MNIEQLEAFRLDIYDVRDQMKRWVYKQSEEAFAAGDRARDDILTPAQLEAHVARMRAVLIEAVGGLPSSDHPLQAEVTGTVSYDGYRVEKVIFQSRPHTYVTANLYIPDGITAPSAAVLFVCGHADAAKQSQRYQSVVQRIMRAGLVVMMVDPVGQGERWSYYDAETKETRIPPSTSDHDQAGSQSIPLGDGLARYFIHDAMRAIDYLETRPEVDPKRIGITGSSGGGTQTSLMMLCEPRLAAAAPGTFIMNRETFIYASLAQDAEQIWRGVSKAGLDHEDLVMAMAPRPVLVLAVTSDMFPIEGARRTVERTKRFWDMYGMSEGVGIAEDWSTHAYTDELAAAAACFFSKHLLGKELTMEEARQFPVQARPLEELNCTAAGQTLAQFPDARTPYDENVGRLTKLEQQRAALSNDELKRRAVAWLRSKIVDNRKPHDYNPRFLAMGEVSELTVDSYLWWSQPGVFNHALTFRPTARAGETLPVTIALWPRGTNRLQDNMVWIEETCASGRAVLVLDVTGDGRCTPYTNFPESMHRKFGLLHKLTTDLFWIDDSLAAVRTYDIIRAVGAIEALPLLSSADARLFVSGMFGIYGQLAAALDDRITHLELRDEFWDSVSGWIRDEWYKMPDIVCYLLPEMLRYCDLPDLRSWAKAAITKV